MTRIFLIVLSLFPYLIDAQSNADTLRKHVVRLSTSPYARTQKNIETLNKAANYIHQYFSKSCEEVVFQNFEMNHVNYKNVIASFGPSQGARFILGAHYDVFGEAPGADKNASGVAGLLEIARLLKKNEKLLLYRIDLVAYTLGDANSIARKNSGSFLHANSLKQNNVEVLGMINLDCIGFFTDRPRSQVYPFFLYPFMYGRIGNFIAVIQQPGNGLWARQMRYLFKQYMYDLRVINFKPAVPFDGFGDGDQKNYWDLGYPAILVTDTKFYRNKNYHYDLDTFETLDYFRMAKVVDMVYKSLIHYQA